MERISSKIWLAWIPIVAVGLLCSLGQGQSGKTGAIDGVYRGTIGKRKIVLEIGAPMRTGAVLDLKDFFEGQDTSAVLEDGAVPQGPTHELLMELYRRHYVKPRYGDSGGDFTVDNFDGATTLNIYFDHRGLVISPELPHAIAGCGLEITIPYQELRRFLRKEWQSARR